MKDRGLTLIELVISVGILLVLLVGLTTYLRRMKTFIADFHNSHDLYHEVSATLHVLERDFILSFQSIFFEESDEESPGFFGTAPQTPWPTFFVGDEKQVDFTTLSNKRLIENSFETELCRIYYKIEQEKDGILKLVRYKRKYLQENSKEKETSEILLTGLSHFSFQYFNFRNASNPWVSSWDSDSSIQNHEFPSAVKISFDIEKEKRNLHVENVWRLPAAQSTEQKVTEKPSEEEEDKEKNEEEETDREEE